jgi:hypothetical protein
MQEPYAFFYNPMWTLYGNRGPDDNAAPPGTYYYESEEPGELFWYMLDQVVIRPALIDRFPLDRLRILRRAGGQELLRNHVPDRKRASDHLPLLFEVDLRRKQGLQT